MCGLEIKTEGTKVLPPIRADRDDVWSKGFICPKGTTLGHLHEDPDRVRVPLVKDENGTFQEATWEEAYARCEELLHGVRNKYGVESMTYYVGNPRGPQLLHQPLRGRAGVAVGRGDGLLGGHR